MYTFTDIYTERIYIYKHNYTYQINNSLSMPSPEFNWLLMIHISTWMVHWSFPTTGDQAANLGFLLSRLGLLQQPLQPTLSVQCIDICIYTVYIQYTPPKEKATLQEKPITFQNMSAKVKRISSITDRHLSTKHLSIVYQSPPSPNQPGPTTRQVTLPRPRTFLWRLHRPDHQHQVTPYVLQMSDFTTPT